MKKTTLRLVLVASGLYYALLLLAASFFPVEGTSSLFLLAAPLAVLVFILARDLSQRATVATELMVRNPPSRRLARDVQELTNQIEVGARASPAYFDEVLLARLRAVLVEKVALETGLEPRRVREMMVYSSLGKGLLRDEKLYRLLYSRLQAKGPARVKMVDEIVARVEAWKP